jgi:hypothetical protein
MNMSMEHYGHNNDGRKPKNLTGKLVPVPLCTPQTAHRVAWDLILPSTVPHHYTDHPIIQACSQFYVVWTTLAIFGLHADNMIFITQHKE